MNDRTVTELVIDADTSGAQAYEQAMMGAERAARGGIDANNSYLATMTGIAAGATIAVTALKTLMDHVVASNKQMADLQLTAKQVGLSLADLQGVQFGARKDGLTDQQITAGLEKSAQLLNDAQRNANSLSREFEANGLSIRRANGQLISQNQLLQTAADLVKRAQTPQDQIAIAQMLGFTKEWVPFLEQGASAMKGLTDEARKAGIVIDDETIKKAAEFDDEWRKSSVQMEFRLKAAIAGLLPYFDELITRAGQFIKTIDRGAVEQFAEKQLDDLAKPFGITNQDQPALEITITPEAKQAVSEIANASTLWDGWVRLLGLFAANKPLATGKSVDPKWVFGSGDAIQDTSGWVDQGRWEGQAASWKAASAAFLAGADNVSGGFSKVAAKANEANDAVDRAINTLRRHNEAQTADAAAVGLGEAALARFRAEAAETAAIQANGGKITSTQVADFEQLKVAAYDAAQALAKARVASQIDFAQKTAFLSPQDVAIAQQLRGIYGNDVPAALASTEAAQLRVINNIKDARDAGIDFAKSFAQGLLQGKSVMDSLVASASNLSAKMSDKAITDLFSGNYVQAGIEGAIAIGTALFAGDQKQKKDLADAQAAWKKMTDQVVDFNHAAAGFDLGPLSSELHSLISNFQDLQKAAAKAKDVGAQYQLADTFSKGVNRLVNEFADGANTLTPLQQAMKGVTDEAAGLKEQIASVITTANGLSGLDVKIDAAAAARIKALVADFTDQLTQGLAARLNSATGKSYLNDVADLVKQHQKDLADAAALGNDPAMLSQIATVFSAETQKIVNDAGLVGDQFRDFIKLFPELGSVVTQATADVTASINSISKFLEDLNLGNNSILSPQDQLALSQGNFNRQLGLAQGGDADALGSITQYAQTFLDQAKSFYSSSAGYVDIFRSVTASLAALTGAPAPSVASPQATIAGVPSPIAAQVAQPRSVASNDNGQYFAQQTQALQQAIAAAASAEISALRDGFGQMSVKLERVVSAVERSAAKPARPGQRG